MKNPRDELIRIDSQGVAHPIGTVASQRMRPHQGTYRLLPAPEHVVFMRYTGEDGVVDEGDGAVVRLAGEITTPGTICDILALVAQTGWRGVLSVHEGEVCRSIYLDRGNVVGVQTNADGERLGTVMYRYGLVGREVLERVEASVSEGRRFGEVAVELGVVQKDQIYKAIRQQICEVVYAAMRVGDGTFFFLDDFDASGLPAPQAVSANALLMDGVTRLDEGRYFEEKIPSAEHVPARGASGAPPPGELGDVYALVDGQRSVRDIGRETGLGEFATTKQLYALVQSKHVVIGPPRVSGGPAVVVIAANDVLSAAFRAAEEIGQADELRTSLESFTVGAGVVYDMLFRGAGPDAQGRLEPERVAENAVLVSQVGDPVETVKQLLFDYVSFALFSVGAALGKEGEAALHKKVGEAVERLRPQS